MRGSNENLQGGERERETDTESKKDSPRQKQRDYGSKRLPKRKRDMD